MDKSTPTTKIPCAWLILGGLATGLCFQHLTSNKSHFDTFVTYYSAGRIPSVKIPIPAFDPENDKYVLMLSGYRKVVLPVRYHGTYDTLAIPKFILSQTARIKKVHRHTYYHGYYRRIAKGTRSRFQYALLINAWYKLPVNPITMFTHFQINLELQVCRLLLSSDQNAGRHAG